MEFLSTPSARRATLQTQLEEIQTEISIHALREEGDFANLGEQAILKNISIHALREEGDRRNAGCAAAITNFYPRPPRGGRPKSCAGIAPSGYFYPRPPRGGRRAWQNHLIDARDKFLSTPSARRATNRPAEPCTGRPDFYPRPPRGGRHMRFVRPLCADCISIHALREEGDLLCAAPGHPLCRFLSTPSARRATSILLL